MKLKKEKKKKDSEKKTSQKPRNRAIEALIERKMSIAGGVGFLDDEVCPLSAVASAALSAFFS